MLLSELIAECQELLAEHGDGKVLHTYSSACGCGYNHGGEDEPVLEVYRPKVQVYGRWVEKEDAPVEFLIGQ